MTNKMNIEKNAQDSSENCHHDFIKVGDGDLAYQQCSYCGEREPLVEK